MNKITNKEWEAIPPHVKTRLVLVGFLLGFPFGWVVAILSYGGM